MTPAYAHSYPFDPTCGYDLAQLLNVQAPPEPKGFAAFWQQTFEQTCRTPLALLREPMPAVRPGFRVTLLRYTGFGGFRLGAWLVEPTAATQSTSSTSSKPLRYIVNGHGYYNRPFDDIHYDSDAITLFMAFRGLGLSRGGCVSDQTMLHVLSGIDSRDTYIHRGCCCDVWTAAGVMLHLFPQARNRLEYHGQSFGGGIGMMALPWDARYVFADIDIPSFGNHPLRVTLPSVGSGEAVRRKYQRHPEILDVLAFYDAAVHARRLNIPTHIACAGFDPAVVPPGQFCIHNTMTCPKQLFIRTAAHFAFENAAAEESARAESARIFFESVRGKTTAHF
jgi:cephalosporin-C deacetylase